MRGGGQEVGGPSTGVLRKRATTNVVARFLPFILPLPTPNACYAQTATITTSLASKREVEVVFFSFFRHVTHHLPRIQSRAGGGVFRSFNTSPTTTTSLASKREPEVVFFDVSTCLLPPPPPSHPNASRRWFFQLFRHVSRHHHLPRVQTRAGGGFFRPFAMSPATTTSLASKREPEVVFSTLSPCLPPPPPPSCPNTSRRWCFRRFRHVSHHHHLPRIQTRAGGGVF